MSDSTLADEIIDGGDVENNVEKSEEASSFTVSLDDKVKKSRTFEWFHERQFDKYFEFVKAKSEKSVSVLCTLCAPKKTLTCTTNSAFNLNIHIKVIIIIKQIQLP